MKSKVTYILCDGTVVDLSDVVLKKKTLDISIQPQARSNFQMPVQHIKTPFAHAYMHI